MKTVYLAGPIANLHYDEANDWRILASAALNDVGIDALSPMRAKAFLKYVGKIKSKDYPDHPLSTDDGITTRDRNDVMDCDVVLVNFLGAHSASPGTPVEFGWADILRKPVVMVIEREGSPYDHPIIRSIAGFRVETLDEGLDVVKSILI